MRKDNEMSLPILILFITVILNIGIGFCFNLMLNGKHDLIVYIIAASILLIINCVLILIAIFYIVRIIISKVRDTEVINNLEKKYNKLPK